MVQPFDNALLRPWDTPFGLPPFEAVRAEHFVPAFEVALREHLAEVDAIADASAAPTFDNTAAALDRAGARYHRIEALFHNLASSETSAALQAVEREMAPRLAAHSNAIHLNGRLFARIDALHAGRAQLGLGAEQQRLLERLHVDFVRRGARLSGADRLRFAEVMEGLAGLTTRFGQNVLADESSFQLPLRDESDLAGLPGFVRAAARQAASERGLADAGVVTLSRSLVVPFLTFSDRRDLREQAWRAWTTRGEHPGPHDNRPVAREILALRREQAALLGFDCYADYALADTMARRQAAVQDLLATVWKPAKARAEAERAELEAFAREQGLPDAVEAWDWRWLAERLRQQRFGIDENEVKPYFPLERMVEAVFDCAQRLFGIRFTARSDIRAYHPDVRVYEVHDAQGGALGLFLHDNFARATKRSGAWMSSFRVQSRNGEAALPIIANNNNFAKAAPGEPTLLSFDDARTLFHEFGHGLHGLLSNVTYRRLAGTHVLRDFVELPSQLFEHWLDEPEVLRRHARHHATGAPIPDALAERLRAARQFQQGYETVRYTASAMLDMAAHAVPASQPPIDDVVAFERALCGRIGVPHGVGLNHRLTHFQHLFSGSSYAAGYYVYLWAEVLDADGYDAFREAGDPFDPGVARRVREHVYAAGDSVEPGATYRAFRGRDPQVEPMLRKKGLLAPA